METMKSWAVRGKRPEKTCGWEGASKGSTARRWVAAQEIGAIAQKSNVTFTWCPIWTIHFFTFTSSMGRKNELFYMLVLCTWQAQELHQALIEAAIF